MISLMTTTAMTDRSVVAARSLGISLPGTGLSSAALLVLPIRERSERPTQAPAVAAIAKAQAAFGFAAATNGAGTGIVKSAFAATGNGYANEQQKTQQHGSKWAFRGLEPWSDPA
ncbi:hypothetical protein [Streptomyces sp.]|uniref:hypothetical protein n=1 Tax=Streptomyces sp. TaxID=1931 RepID=UPI002F3F48A1